MKHIVIRQLVPLIILVIALLASNHVNASVSEVNNKPATEKAKKKAAHGGQTRFIPGSAETNSERGTRLRRECKGRVNAGACEGYTS